MLVLLAGVGLWSGGPGEIGEWAKSAMNSGAGMPLPATVSADIADAPLAPAARQAIAAIDQLTIERETAAIDPASMQQAAAEAEQPTAPGQASAPRMMSDPARPKPHPVKDAAPQDRRLIALTFDDGPDGKYTPKVLDILKDNEVTATFFLVGAQVGKCPEVAKRIVDEGHTIGNHSWSHQNLSRMKPEALDTQVKRAQDAISDATGVVPALMRAPYGALSETFLAYLHEQHLRHVYWTVDPRDWDGTSVADMRSNILQHAKPGGIILLHSFGGRKHALEHTLELLPLLIDDLRKEGYAFTTVDRMIAEEAVVASAIK